MGDHFGGGITRSLGQCPAAQRVCAQYQLSAAARRTRDDETMLCSKSFFRGARCALALTAMVALAGCASIRNAQPKTAEIDGQRYEFGGTYNPRGTELTVSVNGDPMLRGSFPPYTPTLRLSSKVGQADVVAQCYFSSVLSGKSGRVGIIAGAVQGGLGKSSDKCEMTVNGKPAQELYF
jgi:hypothetical protein